MSVLDNTLT